VIVIEAPECASYVRVSEVKRAVVSSDLGHGVSGELRNALLPCHFFIGLDQAFCNTSNGNIPCVRLDRMCKSMSREKSKQPSIGAFIHVWRLMTGTHPLYLTCYRIVGIRNVRLIRFILQWVLRGTFMFRCTAK
jgi:hypothetical protein